MPTNSKHTRVLVDEIDLSRMSNQASVDISGTSDDVTTFQAGGIETLVGDSGMAISFAGYYTNAAAGMEAILYDRMSNNATIIVQIGTDQPGAPAYILDNANTSALTVTAPIPGVIAVSGSPVTGVPLRGITVGWGIYSMVGPAEPIDNVAPATVDMRLITTAIVGSQTGNLSVVIEDSPDGIVWATLTTFSISAVGVLTAAGLAADRYLRVNVVDLAGTDSISLTAIAMPAA